MMSPHRQHSLAPDILSAEGQKEQRSVSRGQVAQLSDISHLLGRQCAQTFSWLSSTVNSQIPRLDSVLGKYALLVQNRTDDSIKAVALQGAEGPVSDFLVRCYKNNAQYTWGYALKELKAPFGEIVDSQHGLQMLRVATQRAGETVQMYAERLLYLCKLRQVIDDPEASQKVKGTYALVDDLLYYNTYALVI